MDNNTARHFRSGAQGYLDNLLFRLGLHFISIKQTKACFGNILEQLDMFAFVHHRLLIEFLEYLVQRYVCICRP